MSSASAGSDRPRESGTPGRRARPFPGDRPTRRPVKLPGPPPHAMPASSAGAIASARNASAHSGSTWLEWRSAVASAACRTAPAPSSTATLAVGVAVSRQRNRSLLMFGSRYLSRQKEAYNVVAQREHGQDDHDDHSGLGGDLARARRGRPSLEQLQREEDQEAPVEDRHGQEVQEAQVHADDGHEPQVLVQALLGGDAGGVSDHDRSAQRRQRHPAPDDLAEAEDHRRDDVTGVLERVAERVAEPVRDRDGDLGLPGWPVERAEDQPLLLLTVDVEARPDLLAKARLVVNTRRRDPLDAEILVRVARELIAQHIPVRQRRSFDRQDLIAAAQADSIGGALGLDREDERLRRQDAGLVVPPSGGVEDGD